MSALEIEHAAKVLAGVGRRGEDGLLAEPAQLVLAVADELLLALGIEQKLVAQAPGRSDRRQRLLTLTEDGRALERRLFEQQRERLAVAYREACGPAVDGFRRVMRGIMDAEARAVLDKGSPP